MARLAGYYYRSKPPSRFKIIFCLTIFFLILGGIFTFWVLEVQLRPALVLWATARAEQMATEAIHSAVRDSVAKNIKAEDLVLWKQDVQGSLVAAQYDMAQVNRIIALTTLRVQDTLRTLAQERIPMPLGQVLGSSILASLGPTVPIRIIPVGTVEAYPYATFQTGGINQVWHRISLLVRAQVRIVVPTIAETAVIETQVPITEEVLLGRVPDVFFNWSGDPSQEITVPIGMGGLGGLINQN